MKLEKSFSFKFENGNFSWFFAGVALGLKNWIRITIGVEAQMLEDALERLNGFCKRHLKKTETSFEALKLSDNGEI